MAALIRCVYPLPFPFLGASFVCWPPAASRRHRTETAPGLHPVFSIGDLHDRRLALACNSDDNAAELFGKDFGHDEHPSPPKDQILTAKVSIRPWAAPSNTPHGLRHVNGDDRPSKYPQRRHTSHGPFPDSCAQRDWSFSNSGRLETTTSLTDHQLI